MWLLGFVGGLCSYISVRDKTSKKVLSRAGIDPTRIHLTFDACINATWSRKVRSGADGSKSIGINVLPFYKMYRGQDDRDMRSVEIISEVVAALNKRGVVDRAVVLPMSVKVGEADTRVCSLLSESLDQHGISADEVSVEGAYECLRNMNDVDGLIGMRYHSIVAAYCVGTPFVAVSYHPKCRTFCSEIGYDNQLVIDVESLQVSALESACLMMFSDRSCYGPDQMTRREARERFQRSFFPGALC